MGIKIDISNMIGEEYGRLTVVKEAVPRKDGTGRNIRHMLCLCSCGTFTECSLANIRKGTSTSCGCKAKDSAANRRLDPEIKRIRSIWSAMKGRCYRKDNPRYPSYGAKGVSMCEDWLQFSGFLQWWEDVRATLPENHSSIERMDPKGGYNPDNCTLIPREQQAYNKSKQSNNSSGVTGVKETVDGRWSATWREGGRARSKSFTIAKYGYEGAFQKACEAREEALKRLVQQGIPYTPHHGK